MKNSKLLAALILSVVSTLAAAQGDRQSQGLSAQASRSQGVAQSHTDQARYERRELRREKAKEHEAKEHEKVRGAHGPK